MIFHFLNRENHFIIVMSQERHDVSDPRPLECWFNILFGQTSKKQQRSALLALCEVNPSVTDGFPSHKGKCFHFITSSSGVQAWGINMPTHSKIQTTITWWVTSSTIPRHVRTVNRAGGHSTNYWAVFPRLAETILLLFVYCRSKYVLISCRKHELCHIYIYKPFYA